MAQKEYQYTIQNTIEKNWIFPNRKIEHYNKLKEKVQSFWDAYNDSFEDAEKTIQGTISKEGMKHIHKFYQQYKEAKDELDEFSQQFKYERKNKPSDGFMLNARSTKKITRIIHYLFRKHRSSKGTKLLWYTFTIPDKLDGSDYVPELDDQVVNHKFRMLLKNLRKRHGLQSYLSVAERQTGLRRKDKGKTNKLHFHVIFVQKKNQYLNVRSVNGYWLKLLNEVGYKTMSNRKIRTNYIELIQRVGSENLAYMERTHDFSVLIPKNDIFYAVGQKNFVINDLGLVYNPVDAEQIKDVKKLTAYIAKYVKKSSKEGRENNDQDQDQDKDKIYCRVWMATRDLNVKDLVRKFDFDNIDEFMEGIKHHVWKVFDIEKEIGTAVYVFRRWILKESALDVPYIRQMMASMVT